ncbi:MAG TPA: DsbA family oxidoreductase [Acidimicrobiales bacterium]|nr:DsbA family oxidoreductase [Acidimicrobiales bacterium]
MTVEIWSDVVCPWCYVGKRRFESALARFPHRRQVEVRWRSFELDPSAPAPADADLVGHLAAKYRVSREEARAMNDRVTAVAAGEGLALRLEQARRGRTFDAHRLLHLGAARGVQGALAERLMAAYFTEGEPLADHQALVRAAVAVGLDGAEAGRVLAGDAYADDVRADQADARRLGISAVPFFVVDRRYGVAGAQPADVVLAALEQAWARRSSRPGADASAEGG